MNHSVIGHVLTIQLPDMHGNRMPTVLIFARFNFIAQFNCLASCLDHDRACFCTGVLSVARLMAWITVDFLRCCRCLKTWSECFATTSLLLSSFSTPNTFDIASDKRHRRNTTIFICARWLPKTRILKCKKIY